MKILILLIILVLNTCLADNTVRPFPRPHPRHPRTIPVVTNFTWLIMPQYEWIDRFSSSVVKVKYKEHHTVKTYFVDQNNKIIYDEYDPRVEGSPTVGDRYVNNLIPAIDKKPPHRYGFMDKQGKFVIEPTFYYANNFSEGLAGVRVSNAFNQNNWRYIDLTGNVVMTPDIGPNHTASPFSDGLAWFSRSYPSHLHGYIDRSGKQVLSMKYDINTGHFRDGYAVHKVPSNGMWCFMNKRGLLAKCFSGLSHIEYLHQGWAVYQKGNKFGFIGSPKDNSGTWTQRQARFDGARDYGFNLAPVKKGNKWGYIDIHGKDYIPYMFDEAMPVYEGIAAVKLNGKWGFIKPKLTFPGK